MGQIALMGDIFSKAATVYVWLGEGNPASHRAMKYLETAVFTDYFRDSGASRRKRPRIWAAL
jgi:Heterokaryon incompatibility protein (HET)